MSVFDEHYRESVALRDGSQVTLRLVRPDDKQLLRRGFARLSPASRYRRFLSAKNELSDAELAYFTELDQQNHLAIGALARDDAGEEEGVAIARFIRSTTDPRAAEAAVAVVDDWQRRGLGTLLLLRLAAAARERGIERFTARALSSNAEIREILGQLPEGVQVAYEGDQLGVAVELAGVPAPQLGAGESGTMHGRLLALVARGLLRWLR